jgi:hypothetical protein
MIFSKYPWLWLLCLTLYQVVTLSLGIPKWQLLFAKKNKATSVLSFWRPFWTLFGDEINF